MTQFEIALKQDQIKCDICGAVMLAMYGGGWDNDRIVCGDRLNCGAEIEFPTSTAVDWPLTVGILNKKLDHWNELKMCSAIEWAHDSGNWKHAPKGGQFPIVYRQYEKWLKTLDKFAGTGIVVTDDVIEECYRRSAARIRALYRSDAPSQHITDEVWEVICAAEDQYGQDYGMKLAGRIQQYAELNHGFCADNVTCRREWKKFIYGKKLVRAAV